MLSEDKVVVEIAQPGYFLADNGEQIKKCCEHCAYVSDESADYSLVVYWVCDHSEKMFGVVNLKNFPFKNGCKHFEPNPIFTVDWDAEARKLWPEDFDAER